MIGPDSREVALDALRLTPLTPDARRAARTRTMCRHRLARQDERRQRTAMRRARTIGVLAPLLLGACGLLYAAVLVATTLRLENLLP